jgi:hypothetical protein
MLTKTQAVSEINRRLAAGDPDRRIFRSVRRNYEAQVRRVAAQIGEGSLEADVVTLVAEEQMAADGIREGVSA